MVTKIITNQQIELQILCEKRKTNNEKRIYQCPEIYTVLKINGHCIYDRNLRLNVNCFPDIYYY